MLLSSFPVLAILYLSTLSLAVQNPPSNSICRMNDAATAQTYRPQQQNLLPRKIPVRPEGWHPPGRFGYGMEFQSSNAQRRDSYPRDIIPRYADAYAEADAEPMMPNIVIPKGDKIIENTLKCNKKGSCSGTIQVQSQSQS